MIPPKLILLNGPAGIGKTTIAAKYIQEHPLALSLSGDDIIAMIGDWLEREPEARHLTFLLAKSMAETYLKAGHDVIIPYLVTDPGHADGFEQIARAAAADYFEFVLETDKALAIQRLLERGTWGEPGAPKVTKDDLPIIEKLFEDMHTALQSRPNAIRIASVKGDIEATYQHLMDAITRAPSQTSR